MITLRNVIDIRTNQFHSVAVIKAKNSKWFIPAVMDEDPEESEEITE